ncbi:3-ketoacyl-CoA synthase 2-like [Nicotiana tabacum]|uniref:3-ketoacyl-CoA synthase n=1 Tax=Nicotiana tabacum TaxID=4097 RepID=A0A1S4BQG4_TOBAC|nr:PREDICTED: 3-ketoacyl-CoA synthase 2-like [Nicotiana tabacum]
MAENAGEVCQSNLPNFLLSIRLKYVKLGYHYLISNAVYLLIVPILAAVGLHLSTFTLENLMNHPVMLKSFSTLVVYLTTVYFVSRPRNVYLVDFACYKPPQCFMTSRQGFIEKMSDILDEESLNFLKKISKWSGLGEKTYVPAESKIPSSVPMSINQNEAKMVIIGAIDDLLAKTGVKVQEIGIVIVNSSAFNPTPSLSAMIVNHYKLGVNVITYNLGGMGCSAGLISVDLANRLLQGQANSYALIASTEIISSAYYSGKLKSKLLSNCLFRMGASAILMSNRSSDRRRSKYQLMHVVRTHKGADDRAFGCAYQDEDEDEKKGVSLSKDLMAVAGEALKTNITTLGPLVLPMSEQLLFFASLIARKVFKRKMKQYIPDFKMTFEHFCIHAGGRAVLDELEKNLDLPKVLMEPSRMTLYRFGNTSSSSVWYNLAYSEAKGRIKKGDRAWQIGFGSGFKCNSVVWRALRTVDAAKEKNAWTDEIEDFPVHVTY